MRRILGVVLLVAGVLAVGSGAARASGPSELLLKGPYFPESITAGPDGALFVSSLTTGDIVRFAPGSSKPTTFVTGVNVGTAGVMADPARHVLWACAVDLNSAPPSSALRAFDLQTGDLKASYPMPEGALCADIALALGDVYITDTLGGRILRLSRVRGSLEVWSADPQFARGGMLKINGIAFDGRRTLYTTNYSTGELFAVRIGFGGAGPAVAIPLNTPMTFPDGIRWRDGHLYVAENASGLTRVDPRTGTRTVIDDSLDQPSSLVFVCGYIWITEGQVLRLQTPGQEPNLPFKVVRRPAGQYR
jgi:sugar lactone lactonase YvrE